MPDIFNWFKRDSEPQKPWEIDFPPGATESDILYCFRLLLDRKPSQQEWSWHLRRKGEELRALVKSYLDSEEFSKRHLLDRQSRQWTLVELPHCKMFVPENDTFNGREIIKTRTYEPDVSAVFQQYLRPGMSVLDIGANIGYFSLLAAHLVGPEGVVYSWEPSADNVAMLSASAMASHFSNIQVVQAAATEKTGLLQYFRSLSNGLVVTIDNALPEDVLSAETVMGARIDDLMPEGVAIGFVKIDVEGYEYKAMNGALRTIQQSLPTVVSEFSPPGLARASGIGGQEYLQFFTRLGYEMFVVGESNPLPATIDEVLARFEASNTDHIDVLFRHPLLRAGQVAVPSSLKSE